MQATLGARRRQYQIRDQLVELRAPPIADTARYERLRDIPPDHHA